MEPNSRLKLEAISVTLAILLVSVPIHNDVEYALQSEAKSADTLGGNSFIDAPTWRVNDRWVYSGELDVYDFIADSGVSTNVNTLTGTLDVQVESINLVDVGGIQTLAYIVAGAGDYRADNIQLEGQNGDVVVEMDTTSVIRVSDMAVISQTATIDIEFDPAFGWICWLISCDIASITASNEYWPPLERHDFPLSVGDTWVNNYTLNTTYSGSSSYVTIPQSTSDQVETTSTVVQAGYPGVSQSGCSVSYNVTATDVNGSLVGYGWHCDSMKNDVITLNEVTLGLMARHEIDYSTLSPRPYVIDVEPMYPLAPFDFTSPIWVNVSDANGAPTANQLIEFRYDPTGEVQTITTESNGSAFTTLNYGSQGDESLVDGEHGSHGIVARIVNTDHMGISTITLDPDIYEVDLKLDPSSISIQRNRSGEIQSITAPFNAVPGDLMTMTVPIINEGLRPSLGGTLTSQASQGVIGALSFPPLSSMESHTAQFQWLVPETTGTELISFTIDTNSPDANPSNDITEAFIYVGRLPFADIDLPDNQLTLSQVVIDATSSFDPDGGTVACKMEIEAPDGEYQSLNGCQQTQSWSNDGTYEILLTVTDEEGDKAELSTQIDIMNRPPDISINQSIQPIVIGEQVTLTLASYGDLDTTTPSSPVSILWNETCMEGRITTSCTFYPNSEGAYRASVTATDDDGHSTEANATISVLNAAPELTHLHVWMGPNRLSADSRGLFTVNEGEVLRFTAKVEDTAGDIPSLMAIWRPDADSIPSLLIEDYGPDFEIEHTFTKSGFHLLAFEAFDNDDASTGVTTVPVEVINTPPTIDPISPPLPVFEDSPIQIPVNIRDTQSDLETMSICWDLDTSSDSSGSGLMDDDCDYEGSTFEYTWGESSLSPSSILLHVTDDDGSMASVQIPLTIKNKPPTALGEASSTELMEGDQVILTAIGSTDTPSDVPYLNFAWDLDTNTDSDGDGNPANDRDMIGYSVQTNFVKDGSRNIRLMVNDGTETSTFDIEIRVDPAPQPMGVVIVSVGVLLAALLGAAMILRRRTPASDVTTIPPTRETKRSTKSISPSEPKPISREIVNDDPIRDSMEELAEKLYGTQRQSSDRNPDPELDELSRSLREELIE